MREHNIRLSVIIPAYNEAERIGGTLLDVDKYLTSQDYAYEILVVNDGSADNTVDTVKSYKKLIGNLELIDNKKNHGKGYVVRKGMLEAKGKWRLFMDADGSTSVDHVEKMWPLTEKDYKVIIGSRDSKDAKGAKQNVKQPLARRLLGNMGNILIQVVGVWGIWDTQNGFKMFHEEAAQKIFSKALIDKWGFDIEALALARKMDYKIGIIPVSWKDDPRSHVSLKGYLNTFVELFKIRLNLILGKYDGQKENQ
ncbi:MAG: dolichyl-phosphate beta-glucosyltransferase [Candidatus Spechtbacterales bacterium]